jgi:hypothetical protein
MYVAYVFYDTVGGKRPGVLCASVGDPWPVLKAAAEVEQHGYKFRSHGTGVVVVMARDGYPIPAWAYQNPDYSYPDNPIAYWRSWNGVGWFARWFDPILQGQYGSGLDEFGRLKDEPVKT